MAARKAGNLSAQPTCTFADEFGEGPAMTLLQEFRAFALKGDGAPAPLPVKRELWISWAEFNPRTGVYAG